MKIEIDIDIATFEEPLKAAVGAAVARIVEDRARRFVRNYTEQIEQAVDVYLSKKFTDDMVKGHIDKAVAGLVQSRILDRLETS